MKKKIFILLLLAFSSFELFSQNYGYAWSEDLYNVKFSGKDNTNYPQQVGTDANWKAIFSGQTEYFALKTDGSLWAWGNNSNNQLGIGYNSSSQFSPIQVGTEKDWEFVSSSKSHTMALKTDGSLWAWGANASGQLGIGTWALVQSVPIRVGSDNDWKTVACPKGYYLSSFTAALKKDSSLWIWGEKIYDNNDDGNYFSTNKPVKFDNNKWLSIGFTGSTLFALQADSTLWKLEVGSLGNKFIIADASKTVISLYSNCENTVIVKNMDANGPYIATSEYGTGIKYIDSKEIQSIVSVGSSFLTITKSKELFSIGDNTYGVLGIGTYGYSSSWQSVKEQMQWSSIAGCNQTVFAIADDGTLWSWGFSWSGLLVHTNSSYDTEPNLIDNKQNWKQISNDWTRTFAIKEDGSLWGWGDKYIGTGVDTVVYYPVNISPGTKWRKVSTAQSYTIAQKEDGTLWGWGENSYRSLNNATAGVFLEPTLISSETDWKTFDSKCKTTFAIKNDGSLWMWGSTGSLRVTLLIQIGTDTDWTGLSNVSYVGNGSAIILKEDGTMWAYGNSVSIADSSLIYDKNSLPAQVYTDSDWASVSTNEAFVPYIVATKKDGSLWHWGMTPASDILWIKSPKRIGMENNWAKVSTTKYNVLALKKDGSLWAWGVEYGEIGDISNIEFVEPERISNLDMFTDIEAGACLHFALRSAPLSVSQAELINDDFSIYPSIASSNYEIGCRLKQTEDSDAKIEMFDYLGNAISVLYDNYLPSGSHDITLKIGQINAGIYILKYSTMGRSITTKLIIE